MSETKKGGRPPVDEPRKMRGIRLTVQEWATFQAVGGANWLRERLDAVKLTPIQRRARDELLRQLGGTPSADGAP